MKKKITKIIFHIREELFRDKVYFFIEEVSDIFNCSLKDEVELAWVVHGINQVYALENFLKKLLRIF